MTFGLEDAVAPAVADSIAGAKERHPQIDVEEVTRRIVLSGRSAGAERKDVLRMVCTKAIARGCVVRFGTADQ